MINGDDKINFTIIISFITIITTTIIYYRYRTIKSSYPLRDIMISIADSSTLRYRVAWRSNDNVQKSRSSLLLMYCFFFSIHLEHGYPWIGLHVTVPKKLLNRHHNTYKCQQSIALWTGVSGGTHRRRRTVTMIVAVGGVGTVIRNRQIHTFHLPTSPCKTITNSAADCKILIQDAQLSQRDRAAGCVIVFAKSRTLELGDNNLRTL